MQHGSDSGSPERMLSALSLAGIDTSGSPRGVIAVNFFNRFSRRGDKIIEVGCCRQELISAISCL
jgi:hypothetical protein